MNFTKVFLASATLLTGVGVNASAATLSAGNWLLFNFGSGTGISAWNQLTGKNPASSSIVLSDGTTPIGGMSVTLENWGGGASGGNNSFVWGGDVPTGSGFTKDNGWIFAMRSYAWDNENDGGSSEANRFDAGKMTFSGLSDGLAYTFYVYTQIHHSATGNQGGMMTVGGSTTQALPQQATDNAPLVFSGITTDGSGTIVLQMYDSLGNTTNVQNFNPLINAIAMEVTAIPEPSTYAMVGAGLMLGAAVITRRRKMK
ncbi:MAG: PEP-CTERM sorting domain-containing protein [Puniceicoccales bacterium]|jgi:hypothetical protein|nr:PEP-CTERM sorting domain-containing protein [Puniceicoccales bacterium]